jgi:hypothetical protein
MKKWLLIPVLVVITGIFYLLIPVKSTISRTIIAHCGMSAADRGFLNISKWDAWWPGNGCTYKITGVFYNDVQLSIQCTDGRQLNGNIRIAPIGGDSILISWVGSLSAGNNPYKRMMMFRQTGDIQKNMDVILGSFKSFIEDARNIYGVRFYRTMSNDSTLVTLTTITDAYPSTTEIYRKIDSLKKYIISQGGEEINPPMLNVSKTTETEYKTIVAISVNKRLKGNDRISVRNFVPWKMLEGEVHGGVYSVERAFEQMHKYKTDYNCTIMALPFQSLITDRSKEQDTTKWITKICAPIS